MTLIFSVSVLVQKIDSLQLQENLEQMWQLWMQVQPTILINSTLSSASH